MGDIRVAPAPDAQAGHHKAGGQRDDRLAQERRRIAADVHDLVMQDLSFALATTRTIAHDPSRAAEQAASAVAAAERALAGARAIIGELGDRELRSVVELVERGVREAARGAKLSFDSPVPASARADQVTSDALVHVAREAVTNAVKHAGAEHVSVSLSHADEWLLTIRDDGSGFDPRRAGAGFGLASMRRHAKALGGSMMLRSKLGKGTEIRLTLP
jgi:signal transduction histidine kinase